MVPAPGAVREIILLPPGEEDVRYLAVHFQEGALLINSEVFWDWPEAWRVFAVLHEGAHLALGSRDEVLCDQWAFAHYVRYGYSLREAVNFLTHILQVQFIPEARERIIGQLQRALAYQNSL